MTATNIRGNETQISPETTQSYIMQMLDELSLLAQSSGLKEIAALLRATSAASQIDIKSEAES